jgi:hypothetical protein
MDLTDLLESVASGKTTISRDVARSFVGTYYEIQEMRKRVGNQLRAAIEHVRAEAGLTPFKAEKGKKINLKKRVTTTLEELDAKPVRRARGNNKVRPIKLPKPRSELGGGLLLLQHFFAMAGQLEKQVVQILDKWSQRDPVSMWTRSVIGMDVVLASGLRAEVDMDKAVNAGKISRFAGLDPSVKWLGAKEAKKLVAEVVPKGKKVTTDHIVELSERTNLKAESITRQCGPGSITRVKLVKVLSRRPYSARMKVLCWKIGDSFVKVSNTQPNSTFGLKYKVFKRQEEKRNEGGDHRERALAEVKSGREHSAEHMKCFRAGKLPPFIVDRMARRRVVKLFLGVWHVAAYRDHYGEEPPKPYAVAHLGHTTYLLPEEVK